MEQVKTTSRRSLLYYNLPKEVHTALTHNGFETVADICALSPEELSETLEISLETIRDVLQHIHRPPESTGPLTVPASGMANMRKVPTDCPPLDILLDGGLSQGQILELSGPPGSPKETILTNILRSFVERDREAFLVDCQNMVTPANLAGLLSPELSKQVHYEVVEDLASFFVFIYHLPRILASNPRISLLAISSISFLFQKPNVHISQKKWLMEKLKQVLHKVSSVHHTTVIFTSQLSTKMINPDGSSGSFDSGGKGVLLPSLGSSYLPSAESYRVLVAPNGMYSGNMKLLSSPKYANGTITSALPNVSYSMASFLRALKCLTDFLRGNGRQRRNDTDYVNGLPLMPRQKFLFLASIRLWSSFIIHPICFGADFAQSNRSAAFIFFGLTNRSASPSGALVVLNIFWKLAPSVWLLIHNTFNIENIKQDLSKTWMSQIP